MDNRQIFPKILMMGSGVFPSIRGKNGDFLNPNRGQLCLISQKAVKKSLLPILKKRLPIEKSKIGSHKNLAAS